MKMRVGKETPLGMGKKLMIPIWNDEPDGYTLWVAYDEQAQEQSRAYAEKVAAILNLGEGEQLRAIIDQQAELIRKYEVDNAQLEYLYKSYKRMVDDD